MVGVGYWGRSNGEGLEYELSIAWTQSPVALLKSLRVVFGVEQSAEGFGGGMGWSVCPSPQLLKGEKPRLRGSQRAEQVVPLGWWCMIWCDLFRQRVGPFCCSAYSSLRQEVQCWASLHLPGQVISHVYEVKAGEPLHHLIVYVALWWGLMHHICLLKTTSVHADAHY